MPTTSGSIWSAAGSNDTEEKGEIFMKRIKSFEVDHTRLGIGMYVSRTDGDIVTYDLRMAVPNSGRYLDTAGMHTMEHLMATFLRNSAFEQNIVYFGPMGCRTGFYFLQRGISHQEAIALVRDALDFVLAYSGDIPGCSEKECGNYREHDLAAAKEMARPIRERLEHYTPEELAYPQ